MESTNECFVAALKKKLKDQGRGAKKKLAASVGVSPNHLSDILGLRKSAGQKLKERIAVDLSISFEDMLVLGRSILAGQEDESDGYDKNRDLSSITIAEYLQMASDILNSNTPYREVLIGNLVSFHISLNSEKKEVKSLQLIGALRQEIDSMRHDIEKLKRAETVLEDSSDAAA